MKPSKIASLLNSRCQIRKERQNRSKNNGDIDTEFYGRVYPCILYSEHMFIKRNNDEEH